MKKVCKIVSMLCMVILLVSVCACGKDGPKVIEIDMELQFNEYNEDETVGDTIGNAKIQCGKKYKLSLNWKNQDVKLYNEIVGKQEVPIQIIVTFGGKTSYIASSFENEGGMKFNKNTDGTYVADFTIKKNTYPDFTKGYFLIGADSMKGVSVEEIKEQITVKIVAKEGYEKLAKFVINNNENGEMQYDVTIEKGIYEFAEDSHLTRISNQTVRKTTAKIALPEHCPGIKITVYRDKNRKEQSGVTGLLVPTGIEKSVTVVLADYIKEFLGEDTYETKLNNGDNVFYLKITAVGANGYKDASFNMDYEVK